MSQMLSTCPRRGLVACLAVVAVLVGVWVTGAPAAARPTKVAWEAEKPIERDDRWMIKSEKDKKRQKLVSGDAYVRHPLLWPPKERPKDAKVPPVQLVYEFTVPATGT